MRGLRADAVKGCWGYWWWQSVLYFFFESRILTCLTYTSRRGSQHRGQTSEQVVCRSSRLGESIGLV
jgi:hypothetical protein